MSSGSGSGGGGAIGALLFTLGVLVLFAVLFSTFLILPFFIFLAGIVAMMISDRGRSRQKTEEEKADEKARLEAAEAIDRENARQRAQI